MRWFARSLVALLILCVAAFGGVYGYANVWFPPRAASTWQQYAAPAEAGWDADRLEAARRFAQEIDATSVMIVHKGRVVAAWGDVEKVTPVASVRKSYLRALYGIHVAQGRIDIRKTLGDLMIDEKTPLTGAEKQATVQDLLKARSGVYLPTAAEPASMKANRPARGSHAPGSFWFYNNWDFNTLGTIFRQETGEDVFAAFDEHLAKPLGMEDWRVSDGHYNYDAASLHPAYAFNMSARDMARFGQLYLQNGQWNGQEIVPTAWVKESVMPYSESGNVGYGYLWWIWNPWGLRELGTYAATGMYGQAIFVMPAIDTVIVTRADSTVPVWPFLKPIDQFKRDDLLRLIVAARVGEAKADPALIPLRPIRF